MFLGPLEPDLGLNFSFLFKFFVIVVREKWLLRSKTSQRKDVTDPKLVRENWLPIQNSSEKSCYRSKMSQRKLVTDPNLVSSNWATSLIWSFDSSQAKKVLLSFRYGQLWLWLLREGGWGWLCQLWLWKW